MTDRFGHHRLDNRYRFAGQLVLESPLRLSSGRANDETDAPLMRDRANVIYIPATSLKGSLRSEIERIVSTVGPSQGLSSCILFSGGAGSPGKGEDCLTNEEKRAERYRDKAEEDVLEEVKTKLCDVCSLFGSPVLAARLTFQDLYPTETVAESHTMVRDGVGIDRDTGTARENVKFNFEVLEAPKDTRPKFAFVMKAENLDEKDRKLLRLVLGLLQQGLPVGGKRSSGLGTLKLEMKTLKVEGFNDPEKLWDALMKGKDAHQGLDWKEVVAC